ncbi:MAG: hypothetical protein JNJ46_08720 [Myxococcales bacterium]|nr:hypothetical protein [Myxococcales bacterium]
MMRCFDFIPPWIDSVILLFVFAMASSGSVLPAVDVRAVPEWGVAERQDVGLRRGAQPTPNGRAASVHIDFTGSTR